MTEASGRERASIVFRALNEEKWFGEALAMSRAQVLDDMDLEIILVDSGSTDGTISLAESFGCRIVHIRKSDFTFGRSLNMGCEAATGDYLAIISAHCVPAHERWLANLIAPLRDGGADYAYGRQAAHEITRYSERQVFAQYFPDADKNPQDGIFVNNANAALRRDVWRKYKFDENVTGLEDMVLAKALSADGGKIAYVADAPVVHIHEETLTQIRRRYYREALVLRDIMPDIHFNFGDFLRYTTAGIVHDFSAAAREKKLLQSAADIVGFRFMQYYGTWLGHNERRVLSRAQKESYYYPSAKRPSLQDSQSASAPGAAGRAAAEKS